MTPAVVTPTDVLGDPRAPTSTSSPEHEPLALRIELRRHGRLVGVLLAAAAVVVNTIGPWNDAANLLIDDVFQLLTGASAALFGTIAGFRMTGAQRWWRWLIATGMAGWTVGQGIWSWYQLVAGVELPSPSLADVGYFMFPVFALPALFILATADGGAQRTRRTVQWTAHLGIAVVLDGLIVSGTIFILAWAVVLGPVVQTAMPDWGSWAVAIAYPVSDVVLIVVALLLVVVGRVDRRLRTNLLLFAAGVTALALSDSIFAYVVSEGSVGMQQLADAGFVLGPLLITYAVWATPRDTDVDAEVGREAEWHLYLPYMQLIAVGLLLAGQLAFGDGPGFVEGYVSILVVMGVGLRQLLALLDNRLLLRRVYEGQAQLEYQAHYDSLTELPNRVLFSERLDRAIARRNGGLLGLIFVDLDDFKVVNDRFGHAGGDALLRAVGQRLRGCLRESDMVARLGGDEFAILFEDGLDAPQEAADRIRDALRQPFAVHGASVSVRASLGLVVVDPDEPELTSDVLLGRADTSMYAGKRLGKDVAVVYQGPEAGRPDFPHALVGARGRVPDGFVLAYQPIVLMADGTAVAIEALARWTADDGTEVSPEAFVPAAEGAGLGGVLDMMVLDLACQEVCESGLPVALHVNVGASRLGDLVFENAVAEALAHYGMARDRLVLEITERIPIVDVAAGAASIRRLQTIGVRVALDDFGAGYNSLTYLHALPVDIVKLDRVFTSCIGVEGGGALHRSLTSLCLDLGMSVIAEGIETGRQAEVVARAGCTFGQGYRFGRPTTLADLRARARAEALP